MKVPERYRLNQHPHTHRQRPPSGHPWPALASITPFAEDPDCSPLAAPGHDGSEPRGLRTLSHSLYVGGIRLAPGAWEESFPMDKSPGRGYFCPLHVFY